MHVAPPPPSAPSCPHQMERVCATALFGRGAVVLGACGLIYVYDVHAVWVARMQKQWYKSAGCERRSVLACLQALCMYEACIEHMHLRASR